MPITKYSKLVSWVHLSDWHQKGNDFDRLVVRDALLADLKNRVHLEPRLECLDLAIFSGDAAFGGSSKEFDAARQFFFDPVLQAVDLEPARLFMVPGNHDLDRAIVEEMMPAKLQQPLNKVEEVNHWLVDPARRNRAMEPLASYAAFVEGYTKQTSPTFASRLALESKIGTIHVLGLNSAWMCGRPDTSGKYNDDRQLIIGEPQIHNALDWLSEGSLRIVVQHHPFEWLARFDREVVENRIKTNSDFILSGHEHSPSFESAAGPRRDYVIVPAGAAYDRRRAASARYVNSFNYVCLDYETGVGKIFFRRWSEIQCKWVEDGDAADRGVYKFELPARLSPPSKSSSRVRGNASQIGDVYRQLLLKSCDIIDLANLPGQDRLLVQRQLDLRRLFVPLSLSVHASPSDGGSFEELEERRKGHPSEEFSEAIKSVKVGTLLADHKRIVILGDPGGGKTTLARWIVTCYLLRLAKDPDLGAVPEIATLPDRDWLPILIRCRDLDKDGSTDTLDAMLEQTLRKAELEPQFVLLVKEYIRAQITANKAILIIDGLDEVSESGRRMQLCQQLERVCDAYPHLPIIATSRIVGYRHMGRRLGQGFIHTTICDLQPEEKYEFARRWCALTSPSEHAAAAESLIADLESNDRVQRLTGNPMLLTTMALVKRSIGKLPQRRAELYIEAVKALLNWRNDRGERLEAEEALPQLYFIAYYMSDKGMQSISRVELIRILNYMREKYSNIHQINVHSPEEFIELLEVRTGILLQSGYIRNNGEDEPIYEFRHLTFQEYLAAQALIKRIHPSYKSGDTLANRISRLIDREFAHAPTLGDESDDVQSWQEVVRLCLTLCDAFDVDDVLEAILGGDEGAAKVGRAIFAGYCLTDEPNATIEMVRRVLSEIVDNVRLSDDDMESDDDDSNLLHLSHELYQSRWAQIWWDTLLKKMGDASTYRQVGIASAIGDYEYHSQYIDASELLRHEQLVNDGGTVAIVSCLAIMNAAFSENLSEDHVSKSLTDALVNFAKSHPATSVAPIWALCWLSQNYDVEIDTSGLLEFLTASDPFDLGRVRLVCWVLVYRPDPRALELLTPLAMRANSRVGEMARQAIAKLKTPHARIVLSDLLNHSAKNVRSETLINLLKSKVGLNDIRISLGGSLLDPKRLSWAELDEIQADSPAETARLRSAIRELVDEFELVIN